MKRPTTLFSRTSLTVSIALLIFIIFSSSVVLYYLMFPIANQAASNLAALIELSSKTWVELPPDTRPDFAQELKNHHRLILIKQETPIKPVSVKIPYLLFLENALEERIGKRIDILEDPADTSRLWVDITMGIHDLRIGFSREQEWPNPPLALFILLAGSALFVLITSTLLVSRLIKPLDALSLAARKIGQGKKFTPLKEDGPEELALLAKSFNHMNQQIQELISNRTTLLAGISHDLRTPIARITLALEFLDNEKESQLIEDIKKDLTEMNHMISQALEIAQGFDDANSKMESIALNHLLNSLATEYNHEQQPMVCSPMPSCTVIIDEMALRRVLSNLIGNAIRYSEGKKISIKLQCQDKQATIQVMDQGPGIPVDQRQVTAVS